MAIESAHRSAISLKLNAGIKPGGSGMLTKSCSLGKVMAGADKDKIMSVDGVLLPVLVNPLYRLERTEVTVIEN